MPACRECCERLHVKVWRGSGWAGRARASLRLGDLEVATDLAGKEVVDLPVSRDRRGLAGGPVHEDRVSCTLPEQPAAVRFEVEDELGPLHAVMRRGSRMTSRLPSRSSASSRLASRTSSTADARRRQGLMLFEIGYREIVSLPSACAAYHRLFSDLTQEEHRPALFHCATGKDRTGWAAASPLMPRSSRHSAWSTAIPGSTHRSPRQPEDVRQ